MYTKVNTKEPKGFSLNSFVLIRSILCVTLWFKNFINSSDTNEYDKPFYFFLPIAYSVFNTSGLSFSLTTFSNDNQSFLLIQFLIITY